MKKLTSIIVTFLIYPTCLIILLPSCTKDILCNGGKGKLTVKNSSLYTVQEIIISNTSYGTIDPGESKTIKLAAGTWKLRFHGISGGAGCESESEFVLSACGEVGRECSY